MAKRSGRVSDRQRGIMLDFMESNEGLVTSRLTADFTKKDLDKLWDNLTLRLNSEGSGPVKDVKKWKKCWQSWKSETKSKAAPGKRQKNITGGGDRPDDIDLTPLEKRLLSIIGIVAVEGNIELNEAFFTANTELQKSQERDVAWCSLSKESQVLVEQNECIATPISSSPVPIFVSNNDIEFTIVNLEENVTKDTVVNMEVSTNSPQPSTSGYQPLQKQPKRMEQQRKAESQIFNVSTFEDMEGNVAKDSGANKEEPTNFIPPCTTNYQASQNQQKGRGKKRKTESQSHYERASAALELLENAKNDIFKGISESLDKISKAEEIKANALNRIAEAKEQKAKAAYILADSATKISNALLAHLNKK